jgi:hypothetical protein
MASMKKQATMAEEIRTLVDLALSSLGARYASAKSKQTDQLGLEAGLSYIGLILENGEREIAQIWALYEGSNPAKVTYPTNYSLRTDEDRRQEAKEYADLQGNVTSETYQKFIQMRIATIMMVPRADADDMNKVETEISQAPGLTSDPEILKSDAEAGFVTQDTASKLRGYPEGEAEKAKQEHAERAARIAAAQQRAGARGVSDLDTDPDDKKKETNTDLEPTTEDRTRGAAAN